MQLTFDLLLLLLLYYRLGYYPHPSVKNDPYVAPVQREVAYCPETRFCAFDIAITRNDKRG